MHSWEAICWCGHSWDYHLGEPPDWVNRCKKCKCDDYRQNEIARTLKLDGMGIALSISVGIMVGVIAYLAMMK